MLNILVFIGTLESFNRADKKLDAILQDKSFTSTQGSAFAMMIRREPALFTPTILRLAENSVQGDTESRSVLGSLALRNPFFMERAEDYEFKGDDVALEKWRTQFHDLRGVQEQHPSYRWGLSASHHKWVQWISYQFAHSGALHLFWNMVFLLLFGTLVELELGSSFVILAYLGGGLMGAASFSALSGVSSSPLIGASAAVSALMGLVAVYWWKREPLLYVYWLLPFRGYYGMTKLPSWIVVVLYLIPDVSGYLAAVSEFGSVAYSAHIGGAILGAVIAVALHAGVMEVEIDELA